MKDGLDPSQAHALAQALSQRVALIQGPPGTGKTYIGAMLCDIIVRRTPEVRCQPDLAFPATLHGWHLPLFCCHESHQDLVVWTASGSAAIAMISMRVSRRSSCACATPTMPWTPSWSPCWTGASRTSCASAGRAWGCATCLFLGCSGPTIMHLPSGPSH